MVTLTLAAFSVVLSLLTWDANSQPVAPEVGTVPEYMARNMFYAAILIPWLIASLSRRRAIGGWLLFFYIQLYLSFLLTLLFLPATLGSLRLSEWHSSKLYVLNLISVVPVLLLGFVEVYAATILLARRTEANVRVLLSILIWLTLFSAIALGIDLAFFNEEPTIYFDVHTLVFALIWLAYFYKAKRVRLVFVERKWNYELYAAKPVLSSSDKKRLRRRTMIVFSVTFVALLLLMGLDLGDKQPDAGLIFVPLFYAAIAALVAWYLPLRKRPGEGPSESEAKTTPSP